MDVNAKISVSNSIGSRNDSARKVQTSTGVASCRAVTKVTGRANDGPIIFGIDASFLALRVVSRRLE